MFGCLLFIGVLSVVLIDLLIVVVLIVDNIVAIGVMLLVVLMCALIGFGCSCCF